MNDTAYEGAAPAPQIKETVQWRRVAAACAAILVAAATIAGLFVLTKKKPPRKPPVAKTTGVRVIEVAAQVLRPEVVGLGRARPKRRVAISSQVSGTVETLHSGLRDGLVLEKGTLVVQIDDADRKAERSRAGAQLAGAQAEVARLAAQEVSLVERIAHNDKLLALEVQEQGRIKVLLGKGVKTDRDLDLARLAVFRLEDTLINLRMQASMLGPQQTAAAAKVTEAEALRDLAQLALDRTKIELPFTGQVAKVHVEPHQLLAPGQVLFELWQVERIEIPVSLSLEDAYLLSPDLRPDRKGSPDEAHKAEVRSEASGARATWPGELIRFEPVDGATQTVKAVIEVVNAGERPPLPPEVFCRVNLRAPASQPAIAIPLAGLRERGQVYLVRDGKLAIVEPTLGRRVGGWVIIEDGLEPGALVIVSPVERSIEGMALEVLTPKAASETQ